MSMVQSAFKTKWQLKKEARELAIYTEYSELVAVPGRSRMEIYKHLANKYDIATPTTIYQIIKRVEERLRVEHSNNQQL